MNTAKTKLARLLCGTGLLMLGVPGLAAAQTADAMQACPAATSGIDESKTFTWMYSVGNTSFDPDKITTNNSQMYLYPVYDSLVHIDASGAPNPMLATSWTLSDDGKVLEMTLREGWSYHDGTPFDAASVKANIERSKTLPGSFNANALASITSVEVVDARTVRLITEGGAGALIGVLGGSAGMMMSPAVFEAEGQDIKPTGGSGPFRMTRYLPGTSVEYTAVENYWEPDAQNVAKMVFLISGDDNARLNAVTTGAADVTFLRASMYEPAKAAGLTVCQQPSLSSYNITLNTARSEFGDKRVRMAMNHAIDRSAITQLTNGFCQPAAQLFPPFYYASNPEIGGDFFAYDPEKAKALLAEAGLPDGFSFDLEVINLALYQQIAEVIQFYFDQVGIKMSITPLDIGALGENFSVKKTSDAELSEQKAQSDPSILTAAYYLADGFENPGGYSTDEITQLHLDAMAGATAEERAPIYAKFFAAVAEEAYPQITLCHLATPFAMNGQVVGLEIYTDGARQFRGVGIDPSRKK
ncbi:MAG: ABC transporter substrate-binding protein [Pseudomonadota bacterium]|nr:ABC transporter substrate-binding protein [Pseudomonadota bacterium]